jgi:hypothetical protein
MAATKYTYNVASDFPNGKVNLSRFQGEIASSSITIAFDRIDTLGGSKVGDVLTGGSVDVWFKDALSTGDRTTLDGDAANPAGGLIATHDNSESVNTTQVEVTNTPVVSIPGEVKTTLWKPHQSEYGRIYVFSCDFTKKETWYRGSVGTHESFEADGVQSVFQLAQGSGVSSAVVDLTHGKIADEALIVSPSGGSYSPVVRINGAVQTEREAFESAGGHYTVDYVKGEVTFIATPPSGNMVTVDYWYSPSGTGPIIEIGPPSGKMWILNSAECQFSKDVIIKDTLLQNVILDYPVFDASGNYVTTLYDTPAGPDAVYATIGQFLDYTYGSLPLVPAIGGSERGLTQETVLFRWDYTSAIELMSSINMRLKVWTKHGRGFGGERATVTIYGVETDEPS